MELQWQLDGHGWWWRLDKVHIFINISPGSCINYYFLNKIDKLMLFLGRYWQNNMNNVKANKSAHKESVRDLRYYHFLRQWLKIIYSFPSFCACGTAIGLRCWPSTVLGEIYVILKLNQCVFTLHRWIYSFKIGSFAQLLQNGSEVLFLLWWHYCQSMGLRSMSRRAFIIW